MTNKTSSTLSYTAHAEMSHRKGGGKNHRSQRSDQRRDKARKNTSTEEERWQVEGGEEEEEEEEDADVGAQIREVLSEMKIFLWEFGQNDPKRFVGCLAIRRVVFKVIIAIPSTEIVEAKCAALAMQRNYELVNHLMA